MSKPNKKPFIVLSVFQDNLDWTENTENTLDAYGYLRDKGIRAKKVNGVYKGKQELSMIIPASGYPLAVKLMFKYNQECMLSVSADYSARLIYSEYADGELLSEHLGQWQTAKPSELYKLEAYTQDITTNSYYKVA